MTTNLLSDFREFKLKVIDNEIDFKISEKFISDNKKIISFISNKFPDDIISGSLALNIFNLINRDINDIDILIKDKKRYSEYINYGYGDSKKTIKNRLGYIWFGYKPSFFSSKNNYKVDFFENKSEPKFIDFEFKSNIIKVHHPLEVIEFKLEMIENSSIEKRQKIKHITDLTTIFNSI